MPYSGRCGAFKCGFDKECAAKSLILNDLLMHDALYLNLNLILPLIVQHAPPARLRYFKLAITAFVISAVLLLPPNSAGLTMLLANEISTAR